MKGLNKRQVYHTRFIIPAILVIVLIFTWCAPHQLINSDSVSGFEAMKGQAWTGKFNTLLYYDPVTHRLGERFLTWWSPGQYLAPLFFMKLLPVKLGGAVVLVNAISILVGSIGYFLVFKRYQFGEMTIWFSVILILFSGAVFQRYYLYVGGESLNFMFFPWIIVFQKWLFAKYLKYLVPALALFIAFLCKLQMLIVVPPLILLLVAVHFEGLNLFRNDEPLNIRTINLKQWIRRFTPYLISLILAFLILYLGFISKGETPANAAKQVSFHPVNFFSPISSPLTSVYFFDFLHTHLDRHPFWQSVYLGILSLAVLVFFLYFLKLPAEKDLVKRKFYFIATGLFVFSTLVFIYFYSSGSSIDFNTRHLKLTSFLLYPIAIEQVLRKLNKNWCLGILLFLCLTATANHLRLQKKWTLPAAVSTSGILLTKKDMPLKTKEKLDSVIKTKTVVISPYNDRYSIDNLFILPDRGDPADSLWLSTSGYPVIVLDSIK